MDILLWRHAEAEDGPDDMNRALTKKGREQARVMAAWIREYAPKDLSVLVSPARRARETAEALTHRVQICQECAPDRSGDEISQLCIQQFSDGKMQSDAMLIVGHQPGLGQAAALLVTGQILSWKVRKGAVWWLSANVSEIKAQFHVKAVLGPDLVMKRS